ncbi:uncharacterized protein V1518DRAFT_434772 [Limtongia smithiae]|uniref:uncharacterized protein n=1 Tax=Limtongia smithiae TaxID=1125753 RepID=UPI0034CE7BC4
MSFPRGPYIRKDSALTRGRVLSLFIGGVMGLYFGVKLIPYSLVTRNADPQMENGERPFLRMRVEPAQPLELKPEYREKLHKEEVARIIEEMRAQRKREGGGADDAALLQRAETVADHKIAEVTARAKERTPKGGEGETAGQKMEEILHSEEFRIAGDESTTAWMQRKFGRGGDSNGGERTK